MRCPWLLSFWEQNRMKSEHTREKQKKGKTREKKARRFSMAIVGKWDELES